MYTREQLDAAVEEVFPSFFDSEGRYHKADFRITGVLNAPQEFLVCPSMYSKECMDTIREALIDIRDTGMFSFESVVGVAKDEVSKD
jgi:hypothetical protein